MQILMAICASLALLTAAASAQTATASPAPLTDSDIQLMRSDVQAGKNEIIIATMQFTDTESKAFWPVYRDYARDQHLMSDDRIQLI
jgi:phosphoglycolate phosphatase-like HAD superfamily hydrolase